MFQLIKRIINGIGEVKYLCTRSIFSSREENKKWECKSTILKLQNKLCLNLVTVTRYYDFRNMYKSRRRIRCGKDKRIRIIYWIWNNFVVLASFLNNNKRNCQLKIRLIANLSVGVPLKVNLTEYKIDTKKRSSMQRKQNNNADLAR